MLILVGLFAGLFLGVLIGSRLAGDDDTSEPVIDGKQITSLRENPGVLPEPAPVPPRSRPDRAYRWLRHHPHGGARRPARRPHLECVRLRWIQVLGRVADNETRYRYFQSGTYTVNLEALIGTEYVTISNTVTINC